MGLRRLLRGLRRRRNRFFREQGHVLEQVRLALARRLGRLPAEGLLVSVVIGVRDRKGKRFENCLASLARQSMPHNQFEVVVVDYGGSDALEPWLRERCPNARCVRAEERGTFNEARAKNIGAGKARAEVVCCTNADIVFAENFLETVWFAVNAPYRVLAETNRFNLDEGTVESGDVVAGLKALIASRVYGKSTWARGDCQAMRKKDFLEGLGGYDERFEGWGGLDLDLEQRAVNAGYRVALLDRFTWIAHQGHKQSETRTREIEEKNAALLAADKEKVKANA